MVILQKRSNNTACGMRRPEANAMLYVLCRAYCSHLMDRQHTLRVQMPKLIDNLSYEMRKIKHVGELKKSDPASPNCWWQMGVIFVSALLK